jgi:hypothetical protein
MGFSRANFTSFLKGGYIRLKGKKGEEVSPPALGLNG